MNDDIVLKSNGKHPFFRLLKYGLPYTGWFLLAFILILGSVFLTLYQPRLLGQAVDQFIGKYAEMSTEGLSVEAIKEIRAEDLSGVIRLGLLYMGAVIATMALTYIEALILSSVSQKIIFN